jgi:ribosomal RNA-processing protein 9
VTLQTFLIFVEQIFSADKMSDPFLSLPGTKRKRASRKDNRGERQDRTQSRKSTKERRRETPSNSGNDDDEIGPGFHSDDDIILEDEGESEQSDIDETPAERRLRLAKDYLDKVRLEVGKNVEYYN